MSYCEGRSGGKKKGIKDKDHEGRESRFTKGQ